jgi:predicted Zn-dependent peptidase
MIEFEEFELENGLQVILHRDESTPMVVVNTLYDVGARDEDPNRTGFAHLFEHLMFGGSANIPDFDGPLQRAGGSSNAFTSNDITNYYNVLPAINLETALWLESDRMLSLAFTESSLTIQRNVVMEEFKQRYLNQPYGDDWLVFRPLAFKKHPYQWATIGKELKHIEHATMEDVKAFFKKHYTPKNAILCVAGNIHYKKTKDLIEKWFGNIPAGQKYKRNLSKELKQTEFAHQVIERKVPQSAFYYGFKMGGKKDDDYVFADILSDVLGRGKSSRLYQVLKKENGLVTEVSAYVLGSHDPGLLVIHGKLADGVSQQEVDIKIWELIDELRKTRIPKLELHKTIQKFKTTKVFSEQGILSKAMALSLNALLGDTNYINTELNEYERITPESLREVAFDLLNKTNCSLLQINAVKE